MSYYDDSSLFVAPNGYKASVLFAQKPMDANGQLAFTRSNDTATRVASNGLIERVRTNLLTYSNDFSNVAWGKTNVTITSGQEDPFGGTTGWRYLMTVVGNSFVVQNNRTISGAEMTLSFWVKSNTGSNQSFQATANTGSQASPSFTATTSWQRFSWTFTSNANGNVVLAYSPSINCDLLVYGAQLETGVMTDYIPTVAAAVSVGPVANIPRIDYLGGGCGKLLLEPQRTNLQTFSENIDNAVYGKTNVTISANATTSPDGYSNADKIVENTTNAVHRISGFGGVMSSGTTYTSSFFAKKAERDQVYILIPTSVAATRTVVVFNLTTGVSSVVSGSSATSHSMVDYGNGWYRCIATFTTTAVGTNLIGIYNGAEDYAGTTDFGLFLYGLMNEAGSYASSYVNTLAASVTRGADACSKTGISSLIGQEEGTLFVDFVAETPEEIRRITLSDGTANRILIGHQSNGTIQFFISTGGSAQVSFITSASYTKGTRLKIAFSYKANDFAAYINGAQVLTDNSGTVPATSKFAFADALDNNQLIGSVSQAILFKTRLPNSELAALTAL